MTMQHSASGISAEEQIIFELNRQSLKDAPTTQTTATCWNPIFHSIVIAYGFPIPERPHEMRGLELPLPLMMSLSHLEYNLQYLDGFVLKGRSAAAIPEYTRLHRGKRCIQWHIIRNHDNSDLDMESFHKEAMRLKLPLISSKTEAFSELAESTEKYLDTIPTLEDSFGGSVSENRHFLGLYRDARIHLGTADSKPQNIKTVLRDQGVGDPSTRIKWTRTLGISASLGPPHINFGTSTSFELSKWSITSSDLGPIETQVGKACENLSVLYDTQRKVGWMVLEIYVIFHLMRRHMQDKRTFTPSTIHPAFVEMKAEDLPTRSIEYVKSSPTVQKLFESFDSRFRQMKEIIIGNKKGVPLFSFHAGSTQIKLCGVDFVNLADLPDSWSIKHVDVGQMGSGGWTKVVKDQGKEECKQREMILVFFCKTLDPEPIRPSPLSNTCSTWQSIPGDKNYLVTTYDCISSLSKRYGGDLTDPKLTSNRYWVGSQNDPFQCATPDCNRLQKIANNPVQINWEEPQLDAALVFGGTFVNSGQCQPIPAAPPADAIAIDEMVAPVELP